MTNKISNDLRNRLNGIQKILIAHRDAGCSLPSASKGTEREVLVREFFGKVFPSPFRFGSGAIIDATGNATGQLDIVVEFPFLPSFPTPGAAERLYLAESVALVLEVKSDVSKKWSDVLEVAKKVHRLSRKWRAHEAFDSKGVQARFADTISRIPFFAVGYRGPSGPNTLKKKLQLVPEDARPDAVLVIESGTYSGCTLSASTAVATGAAGLLAFANDVAWLVRNVQWAAPNIGDYIKALNDRNT